tara:strand:- start:1467 stop:1676 length:210 start_codon:yes stop_codon:yes gene_type:complete
MDNNNENLEKMLIGHVIDLLEKKDFKRKFVKELNESVDVPIIDEKTEKKVLDAIYKLILKTLKKMDEKD